MRAVSEGVGWIGLAGRELLANRPHPTPADAGATPDQVRGRLFSHFVGEGVARWCIVVRMAPRIPEKQLARARKMRRGQTIAEEIMWRSLRNRQLGAKFRRQVPVGPFVVDFACLEEKLVVEVDGPSHESEDGRAADARRDAWLRAEGWRVVRVAKALVIGGGDLALVAVRAALAAAR